MGPLGALGAIGSMDPLDPWTQWAHARVHGPIGLHGFIWAHGLGPWGPVWDLGPYHSVAGSAAKHNLGLTQKSTFSGRLIAIW